MADKKAQNIIIIKKKGGGGHGHHGGAWKVAYADFVTAMMCFFLVMWLMGSDEETKAMVSHYFNHPSTPWENGRDPDSKETHPLGEERGSGDDLLNGKNGAMPDDLVPAPKRPQITPQADLESLSRQLKEALEGQIFGVDLTKDYLRFSVPEDLLFERATARFKRVGPAFLDRIGKVLRPFPGFVTIEGHVDNDPASFEGFGSAYEFTLARAVACMRHFIDRRWVREDRIFPVGGGPRRQYASNESRAGRQKNRRIDFTLSLKPAE